VPPSIPLLPLALLEVERLLFYNRPISLPRQLIQEPCLPVNRADVQSDFVAYCGDMPAGKQIPFRVHVDWEPLANKRS